MPSEFDVGDVGGRPDAQTGSSHQRETDPSGRYRRQQNFKIILALATVVPVILAILLTIAGGVSKEDNGGPARVWGYVSSSSLSFQVAYS